MYFSVWIVRDSSDTPCESAMLSQRFCTTTIIRMIHLSVTYMLIQSKMSNVQKYQHCGVFPKCFQWIQWQKYLSLKGLEPATSYVRDQDATTSQARHRSQTGFLNWSQIMLQWFIRFPEFAEFMDFSESFAPFRKNPIANFVFYGKTRMYFFKVSIPVWMLSLDMNTALPLYK